MIDDIVEQHRHLGQAVSRLIINNAAQLDSRRVTSEATPNDVAPHAMQVPSPRYYGQFNPTPLPIGVWADALCSSLNQNAGAWRNGPTSAMIEARVMRWLCQ